jgi:hypothetical protein
VIVVINVQHDERGHLRALELDTLHTSEGLVDGVSADTKVFHRLSQVSTKELLPGLACAANAWSGWVEEP